MIIHSLWIQRKGEDTQELLVAWDEYSVDGNPEGFEGECVNALAAVASEINFAGHRFLDIQISDATLANSFKTQRITGVKA